MDDAVDSGKRFISYFAFPRCGKSFGAAKSVGYRLTWPDWHIWIVAPTYPLGSKEFFYIWHDLVKSDLMRYATHKSQDIRGGHMRIEFPWGSFLQVVSADNPSSLRAEEIDELILAEASALSENIFWRHLYARTEKRGGRVYVPTTPKGKNWVFDTFRVPSRPTDKHGRTNPRYDHEYWSGVVSSDPNLVVPEDWDLADIYESSVHTTEAVANAKRRLPWPVYVEQFGGGFASFAGLVFQYDPTKHRIPKDDPRWNKIPDHWTHVIGWDHGANPDPTAILVMSYDPDGALHFWGGIKTAGLTAGEYLSQVKAILGPNKAISACGVDPSAKQVRIELGAVGLSTTIAFDKHIKAGILRMFELMAQGKFFIHEGKIPDLEEELLRYEWDEKDPGGKPRDDQEDHYIAAARYGSQITVPMPHHDTPEAIQDPKVLRVWRPLIEEQKRVAEQQEVKELVSLFEEDPFEEIGIVGEQFDPDF